MHDIVQCATVIVDMDNGIGTDGCGLNYTDEQSLINSYGSLVDASKNPLRSFVKLVEAVIGVDNYRVQYLAG